MHGTLERPGGRLTATNLEGEFVNGSGPTIIRRPVLTLVYLLLIVAAVGTFLLIRTIGEGLVEPDSDSGRVAEGTSPSTDLLPRILIALVTIVVSARGLGTAFRWIGQPRVIGEVVAGIVLGPSLLGQAWPGVSSFLLPQSVFPVLACLAQLGIILYMFLVGLDLNGDLLRERAHTTVAISHASIVVPFLFGAILALGLHSKYAPAGVNFTSFSLFMGIAMAITAFPVLARILTDLGIERTELGVIALACAAADDVTAWCLLALVVGVIKADVSGALATAVLAVGYICLMFGVARPWVERRLRSASDDRLTKETTGWILVGVLASSLATEAIGIHAIFGGFMLGATIPHDSDVARSFRHKLDDVVSILLLPTFFAITGARTQIGLLDQPTDWLICAIIILAATLGKFGGTLVAARFTGLNWKTSASLGVLMNTRGLMELIVLNLGLDLGIISPSLFTMMVLMALVTTIATTPLLHRLLDQRAAATA